MKHLTTASWDDIPHLTSEAKASLFASIPPYQRDARTKGIPMLGSGAIYPISETEIAIPDIPLADHWPRAFAMDVGWNRTAAIWGALNRDTDCLYLYSEHYRAESEPVVHAGAIRSRGKWLRGAIDPASRGRNQVDGRNLLQMYVDLGLDLIDADNAVESGIYQVFSRMNSGRLKVFQSCQNWFSEFRMYRRDERGRVVKDRDHLMDCTRYLISRLQEILRPQPGKAEPKEPEEEWWSTGSHSTGWMG
jgi:hypothetical protein